MSYRTALRAFSTSQAVKPATNSPTRMLREPKPYRVITLDPPTPQPRTIKPRQMSKLAAPVATLQDGTTVHLNLPPEPVYTCEAELPPLSHTHFPTQRLTPEQEREARTLRQTDPHTWSVRRLARRFGVNPVLISRAAPCPETHKAFLAKKEAIRVSMLPIDALQAEERRKRLRELW